MRCSVVRSRQCQNMSIHQTRRGGLTHIHSADESAVDWLTSWGVITYDIIISTKLSISHPVLCTLFYVTHVACMSEFSIHTNNRSCGHWTEKEINCLDQGWRAQCSDTTYQIQECIQIDMRALVRIWTHIITSLSATHQDFRSHSGYPDPWITNPLTR